MVDGRTEIRHGHDAVRCIVVVGSVSAGVSGGGYYAACLRLRIDWIGPIFLRTSLLFDRSL